jgi:hypothetical protein
MRVQQPHTGVAPGTPEAPLQAVGDAESGSTPSIETHQPAFAHAEGSLLHRIRERFALRLGRKLGAAQAPNVYPLF